jgi:hypothetical protein
MTEPRMRDINLAFRFILEMVVLLGLFLFGISRSDRLIVQIVLGVGLPLIAVTVWGLLVAPKARRRLPDPQRLAVELGVFGSGVLAFVLSGNLILGVLLGLAALISLALMFLWGQRGF